MSLWLADEPLVITGGDGMYLIDSEGRRYLDGIASLWCNVHGHRVPEIDAAMKDQIDRISHTTLLGLTNEPAVLLAEKLIRIAPPGLAKVFYSDSGATATEIAFKMAVQYWHNTGRPEKCEFVGLTEAYHGDTVGAMSIGMTAAFHKPYMPLLFKVHYAPAPHPYRWRSAGATHADDAGVAPTEDVRREALAGLEAILKQHHQTIAAICIEPLVMGAAGMIVHPPGYLAGVRALADQYDVLLICDEVATGFGRTGTMFACDQENVSPDLLCVAKGLTGGYLPLAATLATQRIFDSFLGQPWEGRTFFHGHTFTGNPLGCAAALASLALFEQNDLLNAVQAKAKLLAEWLKPLAAHPHVGDVRQRGLMVGIELVADKRTKQSFDPRRRLGADLCRRLRDRGVLLRPLGDIIVLFPPLAIAPDDLRRIVDALREELADLDPGVPAARAGDEIVAGDY
jgi:adenosylmethionine-8-amino-7-oxononanoate aminotransferase